MILALSPDGTLLASVQRNSAVVLWDARTGTPISVLLEDGGTILNLGSKLASRPMVSFSRSTLKGCFTSGTFRPRPLGPR